MLNTVVLLLSAGKFQTTAVPSAILNDAKANERNEQTSDL